MNTNPRTDLQDEQLIKEYLEGMSIHQLRVKYGCHSETILKRLRKANIPIRGRSAAAKLCWDTPYRYGRDRAMQKAAITNQQKATLSELEQDFYNAFKAHQIPVIPQYALSIMNLDFALPEIKLAIEIESGNWHEALCQGRDKNKLIVLSRAGWEYIRFMVWRGQLKIVTNSSSPQLASIVNAVCSTPTIWISRPRIS